MADVYDAVDSETGRPVAIKVLRGVDNPVDARRFAAEIRTTAKLAHPCIVALLDAGEKDGAPYLVMERVDGGSLLDRIRQGSLTAEETARVGAQIAAALAHAHDLGVVHRDVKPGNVLLEPEGPARLADFGIAVSATATRLTVSGSVAGSAAYVAPEQVLGQPVGPGADVYALGLVLMECLLGRPVYSGTAVEAALARLTRDPDMPVGLPQEWSRVLRAMTARNPELRLTADTAAQELAGLATVDVPTLVLPEPGLETEAPTTPGLIVGVPATGPGRWGRRAVMLLTTAISGVFLAGVSALAVPAIQEARTPAAVVASDEPDAWAHVATAPVEVAEPAETLIDEAEILRELRRWAAAHPRTRTIVRTKVVRIPVRLQAEQQTAAASAGTTSSGSAGPTTSGPSSDTPSSAIDTVVDTADDTVGDQVLDVPDVTEPVSDTVTRTTDTVKDTTGTVTEKVKGPKSPRLLELLRGKRGKDD